MLTKFEAMRLILLITLLFSFSLSNSQTIKGFVYDSKTKEALINANVYFNGTFKGTTTDTQGYFALYDPDNSRHTLVISSLGYMSNIIVDYQFEHLLQVFLEPKTFDINEILVVYDKTISEKLRKAGIKKFKKEFLGNNYNARKCKILNMEDILFQQDEEQNTFSAYARKPILIENEALGYTITYHLDSFIKTDTILYYQGAHFFVDKPSKRKRINKKIEKRRISTYSGSRMHFFRSLYSESLGTDKFILRDSSESSIPCQIYLSDTLGPIRYFYPGTETSYVYFPEQDNSFNFLVTYMRMSGDSVLISNKGYFDPRYITFWGKSSKERIGDLLPFEFVLE